MALHSTRNIPVVPGWIIRLGDDQLTGERVEPLTPYQRESGCKDTVKGTSPREIECLCIAQIIFAAMVREAEQAREADAERARAELEAAEEAL